MFEVVKPGIRHGEAYLYTTSASRAKKGRICYIAGVNSSGYPILKVPTSSAGAKIAHYPVNKLEYQIDAADTSLVGVGGEQVIYYEEGEYITDDLSSDVITALNGRKANLYGLALTVDTAGRPALASATGAGFDWFQNTSADSYRYALGIAIGYVGNSTSGYLHYRILPPSPYKHTKVDTAIATG